MLNSAGREIPEIINGYGNVKPYQGAFAYTPIGHMIGAKITASKPRSDKLLKSMDQMFEAMV